MANFKSIVQAGQKFVLDSELKDLLLPLWRLIEWQGHSDAMSTGAELCRQGDAVIHLYSNLEQVPNPQQKLLREFGLFVLLRSGDRGAAIWKSKLDLPTQEQVRIVKDKLADPELRKTCRTYKDVLDTYPDRGSAVDRLVYINITNALLANNIAFSDSVGVDIMTWGPTTEYCNLKKYHSLIPLASAYSPGDVYADYGYALAAMVTDKLRQVRESSVLYALRGIVQRIARITSPED